MTKLKLKGFTLVELIIVITILVILATIVFISYNGYTTDSRDASRLTTVKNIKDGLERYYVQTGDYPTPDDIYLTGQINGNDVNYVGYIGDEVSRAIKINPVPLDPLTGDKYIYSINTNKKKFQIALLQEKKKLAKVDGNYNGLLKFGDKIYNLPSLVFTGNTDLFSTGTYFITEDSKNLPYNKVGNVIDKLEDTNEILKRITGNSAIILTGVTFSGVTVDTFSGSTFEKLGYNEDKIGVEILGSKYITSNNNTDSNNTDSNNTLTTPSCATQPTYTNATFTVGTPTSPNQVWQSTNNANPCYYTCTGGYTGSDCSIAPILTASQITQNLCTSNGQIIYTDANGIEIGRVNNDGTTLSGTPGNITTTGHIVVCTGNQTGYVLKSVNEGATTVGATNITTAYGNLYQWGRNKSFPNSGTVTQQSTTIDGSIGLNAETDTYGFVWNSSLPDWSNTDITNNWGHTTNTSLARQGLCSNGYHIPSHNEWQSIINAWGLGSSGTNLSNALKLPFAGYRKYESDTWLYGGSVAYYWSSTPIVNGNGALYLNFLSSFIDRNVSSARAYGFSVRCIKN